MEIDGMNKVFEDTQSALVNPISSCQSHVHDRICVSVTEPSALSKALSPSLSLTRAERSTNSFSDASQETFIFKASLKATLENHHNSSPLDNIDSDSYLEIPSGSGQTNDSVSSNEVSSQQHSFKFPNVVDGQEDFQCSPSIREANSVPLLRASSVIPASNFVAEPQLLNGSISFACATECNTPIGEASLDINGRSGSHTPVSLNDYDRTKMDLTKLDETIDYVLSNALSDDPVEGMFVLPCRTREPTHLSSPTLRANTPSSGHLVSPSPSPTPSSPHSCHVTSPMLNSTTKAHSFLSSNTMSNVITSHSLSRYVVDQNTSVIQLPHSVASQYIPAQCNNQHPLSHVHLYADASNNTIPISERMSSQISPSFAHAQTFSQTGFQHHTSLPSCAPHVVVQQNNALVSSGKANLVHTGATHMSKVTVMPSSLSRTAAVYPLDAASVSSNRTVVISPPAVCFVQNSLPIRTSYVGSSFTDSSLPSAAVERSNCLQSHMSIPFRQPVVPTQPLVSSCISSHVTCVHPIVPDPTIHSVHSGLSTSEPACSTTHGSGNAKKRSNSSSAGASKRRKTSTSALTNSPISPHCIGFHKIVSPEHTHPTNPFTHEFVEKLKLNDIRSLVSAPPLKPYSSVLPPIGGSETTAFSMDDTDERLMFARRGLKYIRGAMSLHMPKCLVSELPNEKVDSYIASHLWPAVSACPVLNISTGRSGHNHPNFSSLVCSSPEPASFQNNMKALFSSIHKSPKVECEKNCAGDCVASYKPDHGQSYFAPKLLPIFSEVTSRSDKPDPERSTPPLPLFHVPNPKLICEHIHLASTDRESGTRAESAFSDSDKYLSTKVTTADRDVFPSTTDFPTDSRVSNSPLIDSETGELVAGSRFPYNRPPQVSPSDKLHITFTINPSMTGGIHRIIGRIAELLGVDQDTVCYQVTRSGAQITLDQKQSQSKDLMRDLESQLREHFTPLSLHLKMASNQRVDPVAHLTDTSAVQPTSSQHDCSHIVTSSVSKIGTDISVPQKLDSSLVACSESVKYLEESVNIVSLLANKHVVTRSCSNCDKLVAPHEGHRKCLDELATLTGLTVRQDVSGDFVFCCSDCVLDFARALSSCRFPSGDSLSSSQTLSSTVEPRSQTLTCDLASTVPIVLQTGTPKSLKNPRRHNLLAAGNRKRSIGDQGYAKYKRWRGSRWRAYTADAPSVASVVRNTKLDKGTICQLSDRSRLCLSPSSDSRSCLLCNVRGDASENSLGRLLPLNVNQWLHINCALWCYEVYETLCGSLNNVDIWVRKALETSCSHCGRLGAGLPCYNPRCTFCYHVPCAVDIGCVFFTDRGMYCPQHQPREVHPMQLLSLAVNRRVYISRDENAQVGSALHEEDQTNVVRVGTVCLHNLGQLLPHQLESGHFHTRRYIYPVGFRTTRMYWSMRVPRGRARYLCEIEEFNARPRFRVTAIDPGMENEPVEDVTCSGAWKSILLRIENLRNQANVVKLFSQHLKGEDLYGLSEPHIVRAIESLPGVDCLHDYVFNFGRMELIAEMPLAINPSGCARAEPKMQTYVKRSSISLHSCPVSMSGRSALPGFRHGVHPCLSNSISVEYSKQYQSSRSQQYRHLKGEVSANVILGRSRIQGLGLFAARDLEPQTMVIEYIGELIRLELANKREKEYEAHNRGIYMFRLDEDTVIDATVCGGLARYINHSCQPNCFAEYLNFGDNSHIVIITTRHIEKGEELCYDYNFDLEDGGNKISCLCRAPNCRKWMN